MLCGVYLKVSVGKEGGGEKSNRNIHKPVLSFLILAPAFEMLMLSSAKPLYTPSTGSLVCCPPLPPGRKNAVGWPSLLAFRPTAFSSCSSAG